MLNALTGGFSSRTKLSICETLCRSWQLSCSGCAMQYPPAGDTNRVQFAISVQGKPMTPLQSDQRVLFVDFDGVLHPLAAEPIMDPMRSLSELILARDLFCWVPLLAGMLRGHADVRIVVHSSWRLLATDAELCACLGALGDHFAGSTPRGARWESIARTVTQHDLRKYRILDDSINEFPPGLVELIACRENLGISDAMVQAQLRLWLMS